MFVVKQGETYKWPVSIEVPVDGGKFHTYKMTAEFKRLSMSAMKDIFNSSQSDIEFASAILVGWEGVADENGNELPFNKVNLANAMEVAGFASGISKAYLESLQGAPRKN